VLKAATSIVAVCGVGMSSYGFYGFISNSILSPNITNYTIFY